MTRHDVEMLIQRCWDAAFGAGQVALAEEAIAEADALGDDELAFAARMAATTAYQYGGEPAKGFVTFSWCLARYDEHPDRYFEHESLLLWYFKYMIGSLERFPEVPLARTHAVLDDMQRRYQQGGHSLQTVYKHRWMVARHVGDTEAEDRCYELWQAAPRDRNSDCRGCDPTSQVAYLASRGRDEEAVQLSEAVLAGKLTCTEQPQAILTELLLPYLRTGRLDEARNAHHRAYRVIRTRLADLETIAQHVEFCGLTGNLTRGLELVERHLPWLEKAPTPYAEMVFAAASAQLLRQLATAGHADEPVRGTEASVAQFAAQLADRAMKVASRFDARNGSTHQSALVRDRLDAAPIVAYLPLSLTATLPAAGMPAGRADAAEQAVEPEPDPLSDVPEDAGLDLLMELAEESLRQDQESRAQALWDRIKPFQDDHGLTARQRGWLADLAGMRIGADPQDTERSWQDALSWYREAGDVLREQRTLGRLGLHRCREGQIEEGLRQVRESSAHLLAHGEAKDQAGALRRLAVALLHSQQPGEALAVLDRLADVAEPDPGPRVRLQVMLLRTQAYGTDGQVEAAMASARELIEQAVVCGQQEFVGLGEFFLAQGLTVADDLSGAAGAYQRALEQDLPVDLEREVRERRAVLLAGTPQACDVVDDLVSLVLRLVTEQQHEDADHARFHLAVALFNSDRANDAAEVAEEALYGADRAGNQSLGDQVRHLLSAIYHRLGELDQALLHLDRLAENLDGFDNAAARARVLEQAGELLFELDRDAEAAGRFGAAAAEYALAGATLERLQALRRQSLSFVSADQVDEAMRVLVDADAIAAALPADLNDEPHVQYELAWLALDAARVHGANGTHDEGLSRMAGLPERFRELGSFSEALLAELTQGELLLAAGFVESAELLLRGVVNGLPRDAAALPRAAYALAFALVQLGRVEEAQELGQAYGFEVD